MYSSPMVALLSLDSVTTPLHTEFMRHRCLWMMSTHLLQAAALSSDVAPDLGLLQDVDWSRLADNAVICT